MKKLIIILTILSIPALCLAWSDSEDDSYYESYGKMHKNEFGSWVNEKGGNIYGDSLLNPDADPLLNPDADPLLNPDADPLLNLDADPQFNLDADPRFNPEGMVDSENTE